jgi:hypothetical protein
VSTLSDWKRHPVTHEVFIELKARIAGLKDEIVGGILGDDEKLLAYKAGAIQAYNDVLNIELSEESHGD